jgi:galactokinase
MPDLAAAPFAQLFGKPPEDRADAPGRVNLIGEHTDYHDGFVLPTVLPQRTHVEVARGVGRRVRVWSANVSDAIVEYELGAEVPGRGWLDYVQGVTSTLTRRGIRLTGVDVRITSAVPVGAGVSSSAALEVSLLRALRSLFVLPLDDLDIARVGQGAEVDFVGAPVGIMDQMACSLAADHEALFLDTRSLVFERVPLPVSAGLIVIDSGVTHRHADGEYATRRRESFAAAEALGVTHLRDIASTATARFEMLPPLLARRARHIVTENDRVRRMVEALRDRDMGRAGSLLNASHASMRDDYEVSTADVDLLVAIGQSDSAVFGARLTGGGFGGAVVMLADAARAAEAAKAIHETYQRRSSRPSRVLLPSDLDGTKS